MKMYPWSGKLGRVADCCIYCGRKDNYFHISSRGTRCVHPECTGDIPKPELLKQFQIKYEQLVREWCKENNVDFELFLEEFDSQKGEEQ
jgi:hypothetical protein